MSTKISLVAAFLSSVAITSVNAQSGGSCADYPYVSGKEVENTSAGLKILSTGVAAVHFDDTSAVRDAREEAEMEAKAAIAKFLAEEIQSDSAIARVVNESVSMKGNNKETSRDEAVQRLKVMRNSTKALLRGVVVLGSCYTTGKEVRVTVGLKPETIAGAESTAGQIGSSLSRQPTPTGSESRPSAGNQSLSPVPQGGSSMNRPGGFSDTDRIRKF